MGGSGKASEQQQRLQTGYDNGYNSAAMGADVNTMLNGQTTNLSNAARLGAMDYAKTLEQPIGFEMPSFEMPSYEMPDYAAINAKQQEDADRKYGEGQVNQMYSSKFAAANSAVEEADRQIAEESSYARVGGADYGVNEEQRKERINNVFAKLWSTDQESQLSSLEGKWGAGDNRWTSGIVRGAGDGEGVLSEGEEAGSAVERKPVLGDVLEEDEDPLGGKTLALGN